MRMPRTNMDRRPNGWLKSTVAAILNSADRPLGGSDIMLRLDPKNGVIHSSAVFRALDHLLAAGTIRRIESVNGYVWRRHAATIDLICDRCGGLRELPGEEMSTALERLARSQRFFPRRFIVEVQGRCQTCVVSAQV
ncbi:Fur family transcriptional regulator [Sphingomonas sp. UYP23]